MLWEDVCALSVGRLDLLMRGGVFVVVRFVNVPGTLDAGTMPAAIYLEGRAGLTTRAFGAGRCETTTRDRGVLRVFWRHDDATPVHSSARDDAGASRCEAAFGESGVVR